MAPAGEMAQLVTMMSGQNSLCRDTQQDYTKEGENRGTILYLVTLVFSIKERKKKIDKRKQNQKYRRKSNFNHIKSVKYFRNYKHFYKTKGPQ